MANSSFTGAVRSENGFTKISKNSTTGAITEGSTYSDAASITGVTSATGGLVIGAADSLKLIAVTATTVTALPVHCF